MSEKSTLSTQPTEAENHAQPAPASYEPPRIESIHTPEGMEREVFYAGNVGSQEGPPL